MLVRQPVKRHGAPSTGEPGGACGCGGLPDDANDDGPATSSTGLSTTVALGVGTVDGSANNPTTPQHRTRVVALTECGEVEAVEDDQGTFRDFRIIGDRAFLVPNDVWSYGCALVGGIDDIEVECVDPYLSVFSDRTIGIDGTLYYDRSGESEDGVRRTVLRQRIPDGTPSHPCTMSGPLTVYDWGVATDGLVYLDGETFTSTGSGGTWVRRPNFGGGLTAIEEQIDEGWAFEARFLDVCPDGNPYLYVDDDRATSIRRTRPDEDVVSSTASSPPSPTTTRTTIWSSSISTRIRNGSNPTSPTSIRARRAGPRRS